MQKVIVASDSFKGTFTSLQIAGRVRDTLNPFHYDVRGFAISDGGEGFCHALTDALQGTYVRVNVHDPLMRVITAEYGVVFSDTIVIEMAQASGLTLLQPNERDPWNATTFGTGELIAHAVRQGYRKFIVGLGGSATSDCGMGMLQALEGLEEVDECEFTIASDVRNPLCGPQGAAHVFARQKGADDLMIVRLDERALQFGRQLEAATGRRIIDMPGAGAAGGVGAALLGMKHVRMQSGIDLLLDMQQFDRHIVGACCVLTGEGCIDAQTLQGKAPYGIALRARKHGVPCYALYGRLELTAGQMKDSPWDRFISINDLPTEL
ncbi:MAG: glycerate kinase [Bacteroidales bacterium]|nr:glycerate kinase [Bacteroidales bacterium]